MSKVTIKVMINKQKTKVVFAEVDSDFTDILLSFLTLPLGKIAKLLEASSVGSLSNLYRSVANLDDSRFVNEAAKQMLLNPRSSFGDVSPTLKLDISHTQSVQYFTCYYCADAIRAENICMYYGSGSCDSCRKPLLTEMSVGDTKVDDGVGFTINTASFIISDDLRVEPYSTGFLQILKNFGTGNTNGAELRSVTFGIKELIGLLKCCLLSDAPLTDLVLNNNTEKPSSAAKQCNPKISLKTQENSKDITLKIFVKKSTFKLLFAQAEADFVEFLCSFLTIPLGGVEFLLDNNTCLKNADNLNRSLAAIDDKYFRTPGLKSRLMNPKLAHGYSSRKQFLPLSEETAPTLYTYNRKLCCKKYDSYISVPFFKSPKGLDNYVKEPTTYMVTDDLTVTPFGVASGLSILDRLSIPLSDVDELVVHIGLEEALGILRGSLTSGSVLSSFLINYIPKKLSKVEHQLVGQIV